MDSEAVWIRWGDGWGSKGSKDCFIFDPSTCESVKTSPLLKELKQPDLTLLENGFVHSKEDVIIQIWNPQNDTWELE